VCSGPDPETTTRPLVWGYLCPSGDHGEQNRLACQMAAWANAEGLTMAGVVGDPDPAVPVELRPALVALVDCLGRTGAAVVVPGGDDLPHADAQWPSLRKVLTSAARALYVMPEQSSGP
jgi:hypothetical protein